MVGGKVKVCCTVHSDRNIVEAVRWHSVFRLQDGIYVVCVSIIVNERVDLYSDIGFE